MPNPTPTTPTVAPPARTHQQAGELLRRPFAPGAIGFRAMTKVTFNGEPYAGAQVAAFLGAQSVVQRLNTVVPGRWRQQFQPVPAELIPAGTKRSYLACRLIITLPVEDGGPELEAIYEDVGEIDSGSFAGLKALYSDARKRAAVAAGIGAYLYTALEPVVLPIGPARQTGASNPPPRQERSAGALTRDRAMAPPRLPGADEHRGGPARPRRDPRPRRARDRDGSGRGRRPSRPAGQRTARHRRRARHGHRASRPAAGTAAAASCSRSTSVSSHLTDRSRRNERPRAASRRSPPRPDTRPACC